MKRKKFISLILILFFLSSTGIPQVIHQCNLTGEKSLDFCAACSEEEHQQPESCCEPEPEPVIEASCCEEEPAAATTQTGDNCVIVDKDQQTCCSDQVNLLKITDNFSTSTSQKTPEAGAVATSTVYITVNAFTGCTTEGHQQDIPPPLYGKQLLFSLHQLKIAAPLS